MCQSSPQAAELCFLGRPCPLVCLGMLQTNSAGRLASGPWACCPAQWLLQAALAHADSSLVQGKPCSRAPTLGQSVLRGASAKNNPALTSGIQKTGCKLPPKTTRNSPQKSQTLGTPLSLSGRGQQPEARAPVRLLPVSGTLTRLAGRLGIQPVHSDPPSWHTVVAVASDSARQ